MCEVNVAFSNETNSVACTNVTNMTCGSGFFEKGQTASTDRVCLILLHNSQEAPAPIWPIIVGVVLGVLLCLIVALIRRRRRNRKRQDLMTSTPVVSMHVIGASMKRRSIVETIMDALREAPNALARHGAIVARGLNDGSRASFDATRSGLPGQAPGDFVFSNKRESEALIYDLGDSGGYMMANIAEEVEPDAATAGGESRDTKALHGGAEGDGRFAVVMHRGRP